MMAAWIGAGALFLVLLVGATSGFPAHQGRNVGASHHRGSDTRPAPAYVGGFSRGPFSQASPAASPFPLHPHPDTPAYGVPGYNRGVQGEPMAPRSVSENPWPGYMSSSAQLSPQPGSYQDPKWAVAPPAVPEQPKSDMHYSTTKPGGLTPSSDFSVVPFEPPELKAGELSHMERSFEHGNYLSETEHQDFQSPSPNMQVSAGPGFSSQSVVLNGDWAVYPYDWRFLTGQYPPGTVTHSSNSFETGSDHWQDTQYIREYPKTAHSQIFPTESQLPQNPESSHDTQGGQVRSVSPYVSHRAPYHGVSPGQVHLNN